ncbi:MAG TPA: bifunctional phosphoribosyl-AMP cyclohydrolase/phosphoribosyl-ATP diphosphatase HisIE [Bacteroidales bacterium]|nr:bifunctional phosphoribosyl-AMP cyclohydrolase/phosphoribosyl-ATP diphosphatase HisIE [Bacteroidales bacterium]
MTKPDFSKLDGLIPAVIQDANTQKVLMLGFMNQEAYEKTKNEKLVTFYSRTRKRLWTKGEESGNFLDVIDMLIDCDNDTLLIKVNPRGPVCHTGADTCFDEKNVDAAKFLTYLQDLIDTRKKEMPDGSYTTKLFKAGINKVAQKVGEEAVELVIEAKDQNDDLFLNEAADLVFHMLVLLTAKNYRIEDVIKVLEKRHKK